MLASELASLPSVRIGEDGRTFIAADIPAKGIWLELDGERAVRGGAGSPNGDAGTRFATVSVRPMPTMALAVHQSKTPADDPVDLSGLLKDLNLEGILGNLPKNLAPMLGSIDGLVGDLMKELSPVIAGAAELEALKQDGAKSDLSDADKKALEQRIAALEKKIEDLAEKLSKRFESFDSKFDEKRFDEMGKKIAARAEDMAKRLEKNAIKADDPKFKARIESDRKASAKDRESLELDARRLADEARAMAERARNEVRVKFNGQELKKLTDEARAMADKARNEVRVKFNDQELKKMSDEARAMADKARREVRVEIGKDGKAPQVYTFRSDGKGDRAFVLDRKLGTMRPMTGDERKEAEALRRRIMEEFTAKGVMGGAKDTADLERRLEELMKKQGKGGNPGLFVFGGTAKDLPPGLFGEKGFPRVFVDDKDFVWAPKAPLPPTMPRVPNVASPNGMALPFDGSALKGFLKGNPGMLDEKTLDALTKQLEEVRNEIAKLRDELRKKREGGSAASLGAIGTNLARWQAPEFEGFGKLRKGWQVPGADAMADLLDTLTPDQVQRHEDQGFLALSDLTPTQRRMLGEMDVLPWEIGLSLNGRKLNLRTSPNARIPAQN
ncbi:MAG: hypothetical protein KIS66_17760 [Fimbriimonadaceae bacterium]|nr:hypothetical protein [Fimbriimonadaceae bacterium]